MLTQAKEAFLHHDSVEIILRKGRYELSEPWIIQSLDLKPDQHLSIKNFPGEKVVFSSSKKIDSWQKPNRLLGGGADSVQPKIWYAKVPKGRKFYTLYTRDRRLPRARSKGYLPALESEEEMRHDVLHYPPGALHNWPNLGDAEIIIRPQHAWIMNILPLERVNEANRQAFTSIPATYRMTRMDWLYEKLPELFWVENVPEALDEPGEWMLNSKDGILYFLPIDGEPGEVFYPQTVELIRLQGDPEKPLANISIAGITFTQTDRYTWRADDIGLQHDWDIYDASTAMVRLVNTNNCQIIDCEFVNGGSGGVRMDFYSQHNQLVNNSFSFLGGTPILLSGYGPGTMDVNKENQVRNNKIHDCGEIYWHSPAIFLWQSGNNTVSHNLIYNMPYIGICLSGVRPQYFDPERKGRELSGTIRFQETGSAREWDEILPFLHTRNNKVAFNEIHHVMQKLGDGNGIYISGGGHGNQISNNYIHELLYHGVMGGIRTDDFQEGTIIKNNLIRNFYRKAISMKHTNRLINNVFIGLQDGVSYYGTPIPREGFITLGRGPLNQAEIINNVFYQEGEPVTFIKESPDPVRGEPALIEHCVVENNIFWAPGKPDWLQEQFNELKSKGAPEPGIIANPQINYNDSTLIFDQNSDLDSIGIQSFSFPFQLAKEPVQ